MTEERRARIESLSLEALEKADAERGAFLEAACGDDAGLRQEVESLIRARVDASGLLETPAWAALAAALEPGTRLGPYEIERALDRGGMGEVYRARDTRLGRTVALKMIAGMAALDPTTRERFTREGRALAAVNHPHVCALYDVGREGDLDFLVLEHVEGETLERRLHGDGSKSRPLKIDDALKIATEMTDALSAAHRQGFVHRDLKPANVMLTKAGVKLLDFGLAKLTGHGAQPAALRPVSAVPGQSASLTGKGVVVGTLHYMAPEQLEGEEPDARADLWAVGAIIYEMVTGKRAFEGSSPVSLIGAILEREPAPMASLQPLTPAALESLVRRCLAKSPDDRPDSAHDLADDLRWVHEVNEVSAEPSRVRRPSRLLLGATALIVVALLGIFIVPRLRPSPVAPVVRTTIELPAGTRLTGKRFPIRTEFAFSRDGRSLTFSASPDGSVSKAMLFLRALDRADAEPIRGTEGAQQPFFSPDGNWIGFWANGKLSKVPRYGGIPTELFACPSPPKGAFWTESGTILLGGEDGGLRRIPVNGGAAEELTRLDRQRETEHTLPFLLPDGRTVLFTATPDSFGHRARVEAVSLRGGTRQTVIQDAADARYLSTGHLAFVRRGVLMAAPFDPSRLAVGPAVPIVQGVEQALVTGGSDAHSGAGQFSVSATGSLAYAAGGINHSLETELLWAGRDGRTEKLAGFDRSEVANQVRLSPDGRQVGFLTQGGPLWLFDVERAAYTILSPPDGLAAAPRWHPDGRRLTFAWSSAGPLKIWQISAGEGSDKLDSLAADIEDLWPSSWSPDGRFLALVGWTAETRSDVLIYDAHRQKPWPFFQTSSHETGPEFSPDGRWLAYLSNETGRDEVYLRSFPDASRKTLVSTEGADGAPAWSPDGRELFYVSPPPRKMMKVVLGLSPEVRVGRPQTLFDFPFLICRPVRGWDIDRDGRRFLVTRTKREPVAEITRINLVQGWFEELKAKVPAR